MEYVQRILDFSRRSALFELGLSPRAGLGLLAAARAWAVMQGRNQVMPEDVQAVGPHVVGHRLRFSGGVDGLEGRSTGTYLFEAVEVP